MSLSRAARFARVSIAALALSLAAPAGVAFGQVSQWGYDVDPSTGAGRATYPGEVKIVGLSGASGNCVKTGDTLGTLTVGSCTAGGGTVTTSGSPTANELAYFTSPTAISNVTIGAGLTFSGGTLSTSGGALQYAQFANQQANNVGSSGSGTASETFNSTLTTLKLGTTIANTITGASLASNQITLPAGSYDLTAFIPVQITQGNNGPMRCQIYNVTDAAVIAYGPEIYAGTSAAGSASTTVQVPAKFALAASKAIALQCQMNTSNVAQVAGGTLANGAVETYETVSILKIG